MAVTLAIVAFCFSTGTLVDGSLQLSDQYGLIALIAANAYVIFFNASWGPVMWVMLGEMFPNQIRGSGLAVSGFARSEEHTSELQSLMRHSYAVFCLKKKKTYMLN